MKFSFGKSRGATLITGRVTCGKCGAGMIVHYREGLPVFSCMTAQMQFGLDRCQSFSARWLEPLIEEFVFKAMEPASIELSLSAARDIENERARLRSYHQQSLNRAAYEVDISRRRYQEVDPSNRRVAAELERQWEAALGSKRKCDKELNRFLLERPAELTQDRQASIRDLACNFTMLWNSETTSPKDRQELVRILIERIVMDAVYGSECLDVEVQWSGVYVSRHETQRSFMRFDDLKDSDKLMARTAELYNSGYPRSEIIHILTEEWFRSARQDSLSETSINSLFLILRRRGMIGSKLTLSGP